MKKHVRPSQRETANAKTTRGDSFSERQALPSRRTQLRWQHGLAIVCIALAVLVGRHFWQRSRVNEFRNAAQVATESQRWGHLASISKMWMEYRPGDPEARFAAGLAAYMRGDESTARDLLEPIEPELPMFAERCVLMAKMTSDAEHLPTVPIEYLKQAIESNPSLTEHRRLLLRQYGLTFQQQAIAPLVNDAVANEADTPAMYVYLLASSIVTYSDGETLASQWAELADDPEPYLVMAYRHAAQAKRLNETGLDTTRKEFDEETVRLHQRLDDLSKRYPENTELILEQVEEASSEGDAEGMRRWLAKVRVSSAGDPRPWHWKGVMHVMRQEWEQAEAALRESIRRDPFDWIGCHQLGTVLAHRGDVDASKRYLELGALGNQIRREITDLKSIDQLTPSLLHQMHRYAESADQKLIADRLKTLIERGVE